MSTTDRQPQFPKHLQTFAKNNAKILRSSYLFHCFDVVLPPHLETKIKKRRKNRERKIFLKPTIQLTE